ncbi:MAG: hypothetical protein E6K81_09965 [Candidatus Eisenbacteria bacterium]|uniref:Putative zinc-finger domain-containing protein n=1 Tax=Eiseniibacteriota bacterium TaxID=2212470 RepID=A0A538U722_UNCEI|nr:MAG: hypothetical protein E6K81_09965 [Candidatus Eisenbacteria bacterium]
MTMTDTRGPACGLESGRLSAYLDGELTNGERRAVEAHLAGCEGCTALLADLRRVVDQARSLADAAPPEDLWPGIERQLKPRARRTPAPAQALAGPSAWWRRRLDLAVPQLAAAAVVLVLLSAGAMWLLLHGSGTRGPAVTGVTPVAPPPVAAARPESTQAPLAAAAPPASPALVTAGNAGYDAAVAELEDALASGRGRLDPRTLRVVEQNLRVIDRALDEARRAVAADPGNTWLRSHLAATMKRKVDLLRSATLLASTQG